MRKYGSEYGELYEVCIFCYINIREREAWEKEDGICDRCLRKYLSREYPVIICRCGKEIGLSQFRSDTKNKLLSAICTNCPNKDKMDKKEGV